MSNPRDNVFRCADPDYQKLIESGNQLAKEIEEEVLSLPRTSTKFIPEGVLPPMSTTDRYCVVCGEKVDMLNTHNGECKKTEDGLHVVETVKNEAVRATAARAGIRLILNYIGIPRDDPGTVATPNRVLKAFKEMTAGYKADPKTVLGTVFEENGADEIVIVRDIPFVSLCEHHLLPFTGTVDVGYLPSGYEWGVDPGEGTGYEARGTKFRIVGLSKIARLVDCFSQRLQLQERMTKQITEALMDEPLKARGAIVVVHGSHSCMSCRGVKKHDTTMTTSCCLGTFREDLGARQEFFSLCGVGK